MINTTNFFIHVTYIIHICNIIVIALAYSLCILCTQSQLVSFHMLDTCKNEIQTTHLFVVLNFLNFARLSLDHKEVVAGVHTYAPRCLKLAVVNVAEEVTVLVQYVDAVVGEV